MLQKILAISGGVIAVCGVLIGIGLVLGEVKSLRTDINKLSELPDKVTELTVKVDLLLGYGGSILFIGFLDEARRGGYIDHNSDDWYVTPMGDRVLTAGIKAALQEIKKNDPGASDQIVLSRLSNTYPEARLLRKADSAKIAIHELLGTILIFSRNLQ